ncbi:MAG: hypothetical protein JW785_08160 [Acidimicrobiia bacterium]|nr:hypothetical protein [Acidimicrobiia bacterium]
MPDLGTQLRWYYDSVVVLADPADIIAGRRRVPSGLEQEAAAPWWRRPVVVATVAAALTLLLIGGIALLSILPSEGPVVTTTTVPPTTTAVPPPTTTSTVAPTTTAAPTTSTTSVPGMPARLGTTWQRLPEQPALQDGWIAAVTDGGPGLVAVGGSHLRADASVWVSADGSVWERVESAAFGSGREDDDQFMVDVASTPLGLIAVGSTDVWVSADGLTWERVARDEDVFGPGSSIERVVAGGPGLVALGTLDNVPTIWVSADAVTWTRVDSDLESDGVPAVLLDVAVWDGLLVAVGYADPGRDLGARMGADDIDLSPAVWLSSDGLSWARLPADAIEPEADSSYYGSWMQGVTTNADGLVAVGSAAWASPDGREWTLLGSQPAWASSLLLGTRAMVTAVDGRLLATFLTGEDLWVSGDGGVTWGVSATFQGGIDEVIDGQWANQAFGTVNRVIRTGSGLVAVGSFVEYSGTEDLGKSCSRSPGSCRSDAAIWIGQWNEN